MNTNRKKEITKEDILDAVIKNNSVRSVLECLQLIVHATNYRWLERKFKKFSINTDHFLTPGEQNRRYPITEKECPVCNTVFKARQGSPREKATCSYSCANTYFRTGEDHPKWVDCEDITFEGKGRNAVANGYRKICFTHHEKKCIICEEKLIVAVHHFDKNHENNSPENLIPLCPTHHIYWHSNHQYVIYDKVKAYVEEWKQNQNKL